MQSQIVERKFETAFVAWLEFVPNGFMSCAREIWEEITLILGSHPEARSKSEIERLVRDYIQDRLETQLPRNLAQISRVNWNDCEELVTVKACLTEEEYQILWGLAAGYTLADIGYINNIPNTFQALQSIQHKLRRRLGESVNLCNLITADPQVSRLN